MEAGKTAYRCRCGREIEEARPGETVTCPDCGIKFAIEDGCAKFKILPEISEDEFVRAAWVHLAKSDVPLAAFERDLSDVEIIERRIVVDTIKAKVSSKAFASFAKDMSVESECDVESVAYVESGKRDLTDIVAGEEGAGLSGGEEKEHSEAPFELDEFIACFGKAESSSFVSPDAYECKTMKTTQQSRWEADRKHDDDINEAAKCLLFDGQYRYEEHVSEIYERYTQIFLVSEYHTTLTCNGKTYVLAAYPFGDAEVYGEEIENNMGARALEKEKRKALAKETEKLREDSSKEKRHKNTPLTIATLVLCGVTALGALIYGLTLITYNFLKIYMFRFLPNSTMIVGLVIASIILVAAVVVTIVNRAMASRLSTTDSMTDDMDSDKVVSADSSTRESAHADDERRMVKALAISAVALWCIFIVVEYIFVTIFSVYAIEHAEAGPPSLSDMVSLVLLIILTAIFAGAIAVSVVNAVMAIRNGRKIDSKVDEVIQSKEEEMISEVESFAKHYRSELLDALNAKLASLGMDPAETADLEQSDLES